jgi:hypothetical protein
LWSTFSYQRVAGNTPLVLQHFFFLGNQETVAYVTVKGD